MVKRALGVDGPHWCLRPQNNLAQTGMTEKLRDRVYEVSGTDPVKVAIMGAELFVTPTGA